MHLGRQFRQVDGGGGDGLQQSGVLCRAVEDLGFEAGDAFGDFEAFGFEFAVAGADLLPPGAVVGVGLFEVEGQVPLASFDVGEVALGGFDRRLVFGGFDGWCRGDLVGEQLGAFGAEHAAGDDVVDGGEDGLLADVDGAGVLWGAVGELVVAVAGSPAGEVAAAVVVLADHASVAFGAADVAAQAVGVLGRGVGVGCVAATGSGAVEVDHLGLLVGA
ncbi:hypothetical protein GCM10009679_01750 [Saccharothrix algeriensis]|uniref:Uncharacterized protein n=1 Tax=Catellatospora bangladeshensis TaxID=310355 RepID=A0A8J3NIB7_9ACTN|nr:hypothetical protein Cba03nite_20320 [Catellatospora bangladeshensis]